MELSDINGIIRADGYRVDGGSIIDLIEPTEILAAQEKSNSYLFVLVKLSDGRFAALWERHATVANTVEEFSLNDDDHDPVLNFHEKTLLLYGVK